MLSNQFMELNYAKKPTIVEVQSFVNMLNEKIETMCVGLNEGFIRQIERCMQNGYISERNDVIEKKCEFV